MQIELNSETLEQIATAGIEFRKGKRVALESVCRLAIVLRSVRLESLSIPAANRPKLETIKESIRIAFGGNAKETDRAAYDQCSLAFRLAAKCEKTADQAFGEFAAKGEVEKFCDQLTLWAGDNSVIAVKKWIIGDKMPVAAKSAFDRIKSAIEGKAAELTESQIEELTFILADALTAKLNARKAMADAA